MEFGLTNLGMFSKSHQKTDEKSDFGWRGHRRHGLPGPHGRLLLGLLGSRVVVQLLVVVDVVHQERVLLVLVVVAVRRDVAILGGVGRVVFGVSLDVVLDWLRRFPALLTSAAVSERSCRVNG